MMTATATGTIDDEIREAESRLLALRHTQQARQHAAAVEAEQQRRMAEDRERERRQRAFENDPALVAARAEAERAHREWEQLCEAGKKAVAATYEGPFEQRPAARSEAERLAPLAREAQRRYEETSTRALNLEMRLRQQLKLTTPDN